MSWQIFIAISVIFYSAATIVQRSLLSESNSKPIAYSLVFEVMVSVMLGLAGLLQGKLMWPDFSVIGWNFLIMTLLYAAGNVFMFSALKSVEVSKFTILFSVRGFITVLASTLFLQESLNSGQMLGALAIFLAIVLVNFKANQFKLSKFDLMALMAGVSFGLANTNDRILLSHMEVYTFTTIGFLTPALLIAAIYPKEVPHVRLFLQPKLLKKMLIFASLYALSAVTFFIALQTTNNSSQVATINLTSVILIVLLGIVFLKEKTDLAKKLVAAGLSFLGLWLISR